jgi:hypothetical protein
MKSVGMFFYGGLIESIDSINFINEENEPKKYSRKI